MFFCFGNNKFFFLSTLGFSAEAKNNWIHDHDREDLTNGSVFWHLNPSQVGAAETAFRKVRAEAPSRTSRWSLNTKLPVICSTDLRF